jgi:hypothetical protein
MEDYEEAFLARYQDTEVLHLSSRQVAAMHFGGVTVECLLKSIIISNLPRGAIGEWKTDANNPGHTITNPGHDFQDALNRCNRLNSRVQNFPQVRKWINIVENPQGHFIDMRYGGSEISEVDYYKKWWSAYESLIGWLQKQASTL